MPQVREYVREDGTSPYREWFDRLKPQAAAKVATATYRLGLGNTSAIKWFSDTMALTRNFKQTILERAQREPAFAKAMLDEAATLFLKGEPETARAILRDLVNATLGFERLAAATDKNSKSLHRMLSPSGNPGMDNLATIFGAVSRQLQVDLKVRAVRAA